jgi:hypothetical protein
VWIELSTSKIANVIVKGVSMEIAKSYIHLLQPDCAYNFMESGLLQKYHLYCAAILFLTGGVGLQILNHQGTNYWAYY